MVPGLTGLTVLARGGYATVYRARQESVGRDVAVKVEHWSLENERDQRRFLREAHSAGRMSSHPHVVDLIDAGITADGHPFLIMELCQGSYAERMKVTPLSPAEARDLGVKIADALGDAHALGVVHRDVKPANILHSHFGEPALADFGLAILTESRDQSITLDVLTPAYAPPEMFRHAPPAPSADVYALCATLYALMRGEPPRWPDGRSPSLVSLVDLFTEAIPDLPGVPAEMMALLRSGMANEPTERPGSAELRDRLLALDLDEGAGPRPAPSALTALTSVYGFPPAHPPAAEPPAEATVAQAQQPDPPPPADLPPAPPGPQVPAGLPQPPPPQPPAGPPWPAPGYAAEETVTMSVGDPARKARGPRSGQPRAGSRWIATGTAVALLLTLVGGLTWYVLTRPRPEPGPPAGQHSSGPPPSSVQSSRPADASPVVSGRSCLLTQVTPGVFCAATPECYDAPSADQKVPCAQPHAWEVFALIDLPAGVTAVDQASVSSNPLVHNACSGVNVATLDPSLYQWRVDVLPPTPEALRGGDRTVRCLAGPASGKATGTRFVP